MLKPHEEGNAMMDKERMQKLLRASEIVRTMDERETELAKLVAAAMQTGYEMGKLAAKSA